MSPRKKAGYMISSVAETYGIHPQTLRLYERLGLLTPSRSEGNTRLYTEGDLNRLQLILTLTREMGVNLAGVEVILNMRAKMERMQTQLEEMIAFMRHNAVSRVGSGSGNALVRVPGVNLVRSRRQAQ